MTDHATRATRMVTTTPTIPKPKARRPLPPVRTGDPQLTDADPQAATSSGPSCPAVRSRSGEGSPLEGPSPPSLATSGSAREP
jgi:hypothetical protein